MDEVLETSSIGHLTTGLLQLFPLSWSLTTNPLHIYSDNLYPKLLLVSRTHNTYNLIALDLIKPNFRLQSYALYVCGGLFLPLK